MRSMRKIFTAGVVVLIMVAGSIAALAAAQYPTPADAVSALTGRDVQNIIDERIGTGKTYGTIADEAGVLDEFRAEMLEMKKDRLAARVADGTLTQEQADAIIAKIEAAQAGCDGSRAGCELRGAGGGLGLGCGQCLGQGCQDQGKAQGDQSRARECRRIGSRVELKQNSQGQGQGSHAQGRARLRDGSCLNR